MQHTRQTKLRLPALWLPQQWRAPEDITSLRLSDDERDAAIELLEQFHVEGRLTLDELEQRVADALVVKNDSDLSLLFADLPYTDQPQNPSSPHLIAGCF